MEHLDLHVLRHGGGEALDVKLLGVQAHGLHEELVAELVWKADNFCFKRGAVPGPHALDEAGVHGRPVQVLPDHPFRLLRGPGEPAHGLVKGRVLGGVGEGHGQPVSGLDLHLVKIHRRRVYPGGRSGLEAAEGEAQF